MSRKQPKNSGQPFVKLDFYLLKSEAWRDLSLAARSLFVELNLRFNGSNNGSIRFSVREAGEALNCQKSAAGKYFTELKEHDFIEFGTESKFEQKKLATEWRLNTHKCDLTGKTASKDFMKWSLKKQKPVHPRGHSVHQRGHKQTQTN